MPQIRFGKLYYQGRPATDPDHVLLEIRDSRSVYINPFFRKMIKKANDLRSEAGKSPLIEFKPYANQQKHPK